MIDVFHGHIRLVFRDARVAAVLRAAIRERGHEWNAEAVEEGDDVIVEQVGCRQRCLAIVALDECHLRVGIDKGQHDRCGPHP